MRTGRKRKVLGLCGLTLLLALAGCGNLETSPGASRLRDGGRQSEERESRGETETEESARTAERAEESARTAERAEESARTEEREEESARTAEREEESAWTAERAEENARTAERAAAGAQAEEERPGKGRDTFSGKAGFGSAPWFRDDFGRNTQLEGGWIYGYWGRQLCRINPGSLRAETLYEATSPQSDSFCIHEGYLYFLEKRAIDYLDGERANLWRVKCDGSERKLLLGDFDVADYVAYDLGFYEDILYLTSPCAELEDYRFFRISENGEAEAVDAAKTLYGMLPEGYTDACGNYKYGDFPDIAFCMNHFGYAFVCDGDGKLYRTRLESGRKEEISLPGALDYGRICLTGQAIVYQQEGSRWCSVSLEDPGQVTEIGVLDCYRISFWDEKGLYYVSQDYDEDSCRVTRLGWDGEKEVLHYWISRPRSGVSVYGDHPEVLFSDGNFFYYDRKDRGDGAVYRIALEGYDGEEERVYVYYDSPVTEISVSETFETTFIAEGSGAKGSFSMTRVYLTEETKAAERINRFLEELYSEESGYMEELMDTVRETVSQEWSEGDWVSGTIVSYGMSCVISYIDEAYIGFCLFWDQYWQGAAHGIYGTTEYVFSRSTGERLRITDVVKDTEEEICAIIAPYVAARADWGTDEDGWESIILEDGRFYLTPEGIGIHFDVYEMTCYAEGALDVVIPYERFDKITHGRGTVSAL